MKIPSIISTNSIKLLSGLGNNEDSLAAMVVKDWIGDGATVYTYKKDGGKDDAREKAIEEFGTGAIWLFAIPLVKKVIEKTIYPIFKLNSNFDPRILDDKSKLEQITKLATNEEKVLFDSLEQANPVIKKLTNAQMYKGFAVGKFAIATLFAAWGLTKIIKYKQKSTTERIEKDNSLSKQNSSSLVEKSVSENLTFSSFTKNQKANEIAFCGGLNLASFMYNPIKNTMILDGVIATTRLKEARKEERFEVLFKEICQVLFIYGLAKPIQFGFEKIGELIKCPIKLDPKTLFMNDLKGAIDSSKGSIEALKNSKNLLEDLTKLDVKSSIVGLLENEGVINLTKNKDAISFLTPIDESSVKGVLENLENTQKHIKNIKGIKAFKTFAVIVNVLIAAGIMGIVQPKINILLRKLMYGTNENPAIAAQEQKAKLNA